MVLEWNVDDSWSAGLALARITVCDYSVNENREQATIFIVHNSSETKSKMYNFCDDHSLNQMNELC